VVHSLLAIPLVLPEEKPGQSWSAFAERPYEICSFDELTLKIGALGGR
jgi:hypothetical protein